MPILNEQQEAAMIGHAIDLLMELQTAKRMTDMYRDLYNKTTLELDALTAKKENTDEF